MRAVRLTRRAWAGLAGGLALGIAALAAGLGRDPWPARVAIRPGPHERAGFTRDGRGVVTTDPVGLTAWDLATGRPRPGAEVGLRRTSLAADGRTAAGIMGDPRFRSELVLVEVGGGNVLARFPLGRDRALAWGWAADGKSIRAVILSRNRTEAEVVTWDPLAGTEARRAVFGPNGPGPRMLPAAGETSVGASPEAVAPDGRTWAYAQAHPDGVRLWDAEADRPIGELIPAPFGVGAAAFTPDGRALVVADGGGGFALLDLDGPRQRWTVRSDPRNLQHGPIGVSPDGRTVAVGWMLPASALATPSARFLEGFRSWIPGWSPRRNARATLIDLATGHILAESPGSLDPEFAPDGRALLTREPDGSIAVRDVPRPPSR